MFYVVGGLEENEILLYNVVLAVRDSLNLLLKYVVFLTIRFHPFVLRVTQRMMHSYPFYTRSRI